MNSTPDKENKLNKFREKASVLLIKYWFLINLLFISAYSAYTIIKFLNGRKSFLYKNEDVAVSFSVSWFIVNLIGNGIILIPFLSKIKFKIWQFTGIIFIGFLISAFGLIKNCDPDLDWPGTDVAIGNYISAEEGIKYGVVDLIKNWNDRSNPYDPRTTNPEECDTIRRFIAKHNLEWIAFNNWKVLLDSSRYDMINNNRPMMHPPMAPVALSFWMRIFPFGRWSAEMLMNTFTLLGVLLVIIYAYKKQTGNFKLMVIMSLITSPVLFRFHYPSTDQMCMFLFTIPIFLYLLFPSKKFAAALFYGLIYGICFYTKFMMAFFIFVMIISLFVYIKKLSFRFVLGFLTGLLVPVIVMTSLGYYFWLTILTGQILASVINSKADISIFNLVLKFLYYGPSFLLLFMYMLINSNKLDKNLLFFFIPVIASIFLTMAAAPADWNRYLIHFMPTILLFLLSMNITVDFRKRDLFVSFMANIIFFHLNNYF